MSLGWSHGVSNLSHTLKNGARALCLRKPASVVTQGQQSSFCLRVEGRTTCCPLWKAGVTHVLSKLQETLQAQAGCVPPQAETSCVTVLWQHTPVLLVLSSFSESLEVLGVSRPPAQTPGTQASTPTQAQCSFAIKLSLSVATGITPH